MRKKEVTKANLPQVELKIRQLQERCGGGEGWAAAVEAAVGILSSVCREYEQVHVTDWMEHLAVCVYVWRAL